MPPDAAADTPIRDALDVALAPIDEQLAAGEDVAMNKPGEGWWLLDGVWRRFEAPKMTNARLRGIATLAIAPKRPADRQAIVAQPDLPPDGNSVDRIEIVRVGEERALPRDL